MNYQELDAKFDSSSTFEEWEAFHRSLPETEQKAWDAHTIILIDPLRTRWHGLKMEAKNEAFERLKELFLPTVECEECEGTGQRAFAVNCPELTECVDCNGTGKITLPNS